jgi:hypothetical protein
MALRERNSALHWAATRPEDITPAVAVAVGHFVQVGLWPPMCLSPPGAGQHCLRLLASRRWSRPPGNFLASQESQKRGLQHETGPAGPCGSRRRRAPDKEFHFFNRHAETRRRFPASNWPKLAPVDFPCPQMTHQKRNPQRNVEINVEVGL